jgi:hypothetical protein
LARLHFSGNGVYQDLTTPSIHPTLRVSVRHTELLTHARDMGVLQ